MIEDEREALGAHAKSEQHTNSPTAQPMARGAHMRAADASGEAGLSARIVPPTARFVPAHAAGAQAEEASSDEGMAPAGTPDGGPVVSSAASSAAESDVVPADEPSDVLNDATVVWDRLPAALQTAREAAAAAAPASAEPVAESVSEPALEPAPTATAFFANACERAAAAERALRDMDLALSSLGGQASETFVLPTGSRAVSGTQEFPSTLRQALDDADAKKARIQADDRSYQEDEHPRRGRVLRRVLIGLAIALVLAGSALAVAYFALDIPSWFQEVELADVERTLEQDEGFMAGFASNDYVTPSAYTLSDVAIDSSGEGEDGSVTVQATARLTNDSFESDCAATLLFVRASNAGTYSQFSEVDTSSYDPSDWVGVVLDSSATTRAIAGVTVDAEFGSAFEPSFDEASQTCTYTTTATTDLWFATRSTSTTYIYTFDGTAWTRAAGEPQQTLSYNADALQGEYQAQSGDAGRMDAFRITNVDATSGTFVVEYQATPSGFGSESITGVINCTISIVDASDAARGYRQADGFAYAFSGDGSSTGGENTAHIEGYLGLDGAIVFEFSGDYTHTPFLFGEPTAETMRAAGTVVKK